MSYTTIVLPIKTRVELAGLKAYKREAYYETIQRLMSLVPKGDDEGDYSDEFRASLFRGMEDIDKGRVISHEELKKRCGL